MNYVKINDRHHEFHKFRIALSHLDKWLVLSFHHFLYDSTNGFSLIRWTNNVYDIRIIPIVKTLL